MDDILARQLYKSDTEDNPVYQTILHHAITALGSIAKEYPAPTGKPRAWEKVFRAALEKALQALEAVPNSAVVKDATRFLFQRLVSCLGPAILPYLPTTLSHLMASRQASDVVDLLPLLTQLLFRFQDTIFPVLNQLMSALLELLFVFLRQEPQKIVIESTGAIVNSYETLQLLELQRAYVSLIFSIMTCGQGAVFTSEANLGHFEAVLNSLIRLAMEDDPQVQKHCFGSLAKMIELWGEPPASVPGTTGPVEVNGKPHGLAGFNQFILQRILPLCFQLPFKRSFNLNDGQAYLVSHALSFLPSRKGADIEVLFFYFSFL